MACLLHTRMRLWHTRSTCTCPIGVAGQHAQAQTVSQARTHKRLRCWKPTWEGTDGIACPLARAHKAWWSSVACWMQSGAVLTRAALPMHVLEPICFALAALRLFRPRHGPARVAHPGLPLSWGRRHQFSRRCTCSCGVRACMQERSTVTHGQDGGGKGCCHHRRRRLLPSCSGGFGLRLGALGHDPVKGLGKGHALGAFGELEACSRQAGEAGQKQAAATTSSFPSCMTWQRSCMLGGGCCLARAWSPHKPQHPRLRLQLGAHEMQALPLPLHQPRQGGLASQQVTH